MQKRHDSYPSGMIGSYLFDKNPTN